MAGNPALVAEAFRDVGMVGHELEVLPVESGMSPLLVQLPVPVPTVYAAAMLNTRDGIGYLRVGAFRDSTPRELDELVFRLKNQGLRALIVDLRGNSGGLFTAGVEVAQRFLPAGIIVTTQGQSPEFAGRVFSSDSGMTAFDVPVVLLIDTKTMSAAEAVAAAWKDHNRATLVGLPTFGKGVIQSPIRLTAADGPDGSPHRSGVLILTVASMFGPRGGAINGVGVTPHVLEADPSRQLDLAVAKAIELRRRAVPIRRPSSRRRESPVLRSGLRTPCRRMTTVVLLPARSRVRRRSGSSNWPWRKTSAPPATGPPRR